VAGFCISLAQPDPILVNNGFQAIAPDLRGFGHSDRPEGVGAYSLQDAICDLVGILDRFGIDAADIVGLDWGAAVAWFTATAHPDRAHKRVVLSAPHPLAPRTLRQREWPGTSCSFSLRESRKRGSSTRTGRCSESCSEAMVTSIVTSRICHGQVL
jgi:pimeloyl-ACP methyl ester carboxylesterase